nr:hypothetical protein [Streptomyces sp. CoT10]
MTGVEMHVRVLGDQSEDLGEVVRHRAVEQDPDRYVQLPLEIGVLVLERHRLPVDVVALVAGHEVRAVRTEVH